MNKLNDNQMQRGLNQALFKYLPLSWIDFYQKSDRTTSVALVTHWNCMELREINENRILSRINKIVSEFNEHGNIKNFDLPMTSMNYSILTPKSGINSDIFAEVSPLTFFCNTCKKIHYYKDSRTLAKYNPQRVCKNGCKGLLKQIRLVYACKCGWAEPVKPIDCKADKNDGIEYLKLYSDFSFFCTKHPNRIIEMSKICPSCGEKIFPKNALEMGNYIPFNLTMIDLMKTKRDEFIQNNEYGSKLINGYWLGKITREQLDDLVDEGIRKMSTQNSGRKLDKIIDKAISAGYCKEDAMKIAQLLENELEDVNVTKIVEFIDIYLSGPGQSNCDELAVQIMEFDSVKRAPEVSTIDDAIKISKKLNSHANPEKYRRIMMEYGFSNVQASGKIPFVICSYGFTRKETEPSKAVLNGFPSEINGKRNIYGAKLVTEGILLELDRVKILKWLEKNKYIDRSKNNVPYSYADENEVKLWFFNNVDASVISTFNQIDENGYNITSKVYTLLHSIVHSLLKEAAHLCGLDKNSLSEYIFPNIPAILIYCQNAQGLNIGALFNLFEAYFDKWLSSTKQSIEKCIFDPICIDRDHACAGCIYLNEISCCHFNKDLDRRLLLGWHDKTSEERIWGFWEEE